MLNWTKRCCMPFNVQIQRRFSITAAAAAMNGGSGSSQQANEWDDFHELQTFSNIIFCIWLRQFSDDDYVDYGRESKRAADCAMCIACKCSIPNQTYIVYIDKRQNQSNIQLSACQTTAKAQKSIHTYELSAFQKSNKTWANKRKSIKIRTKSEATHFNIQNVAEETIKFCKYKTLDTQILLHSLRKSDRVDEMQWII